MLRCCNTVFILFSLGKKSTARRAKIYDGDMGMIAVRCAIATFSNTNGKKGRCCVLISGAGGQEGQRRGALLAIGKVKSIECRQANTTHTMCE